MTAEKKEYGCGKWNTRNPVQIYIIYLAYASNNNIKKLFASWWVQGLGAVRSGLCVCQFCVELKLSGCRNPQYLKQTEIRAQDKKE